MNTAETLHRLRDAHRTLREHVRNLDKLSHQYPDAETNWVVRTDGAGMVAARRIVNGAGELTFDHRRLALLLRAINLASTPLDVEDTAPALETARAVAAWASGVSDLIVKAVDGADNDPAMLYEEDADLLLSCVEGLERFTRERVQEAEDIVRSERDRK